MINCLEPFSGRRAETKEELEVSREAAFTLSNPAPRSWIASRVVTLLSHYFVAQQEAAVAEAVAEDWCAMLSDYPAWALAEAARWWMSHENSRKHLKPLPGDIQARAHALMEPVRVARLLVARGVVEKPAPRPHLVEESQPGWGSDEAKAKRRAFAASLGLKTFGGEA